jgi:transposase, IS5 family
MKQPGFFDLDQRRKKLMKTRGFLENPNRFVAWESFRAPLDRALKRSSGGKGGRPAHDAMLMFKVLVLQALYNISDEQTEYQILDRLSFMKFLGLELCDGVPDARTIWLFRETLRMAGAVDELFSQFDAMLNQHGFQASGGQIADATFVEAPRQRNNRDENAKIKSGEVPEDWSDRKKSHKDTDARWTKKGGVAFYGCKNHVNVDRKYKLIRKYKVTDASVHDSRELDAVLDPHNDSQDTWADSAYRPEEQEARLKEQGRTSHIHERAYRNKPLTPEQEAANKERSSVRVRIEHVSGRIETAMHGCYVRTIGIARAKAKTGLEALTCNMSRFTFLMRSSGIATPARWKMAATKQA